METSQILNVEIPTWWEGSPEIFSNIIEYQTTGDDAAFTRVYRHYEHLVREIAHNRANSGGGNFRNHMDSSEREAMTAVALYDAIKTWDSTRKVPFLPYARTLMSRRFIDQVRAEGPFKRADVDFLRAVERGVDVLTAQGETIAGTIMTAWLQENTDYSDVVIQRRLPETLAARYDAFTISNNTDEDGFNPAITVMDLQAIDPAQAAVAADERVHTQKFMQERVTSRMNERQLALMRAALMTDNGRKEFAQSLGLTGSELSDRIRRVREVARRYITEGIALDATELTQEDVLNVINETIPTGLWRNIDEFTPSITPLRPTRAGFSDNQQVEGQLVFAI
jgi:DNA-directed RNA polymerase specialized sigma subunit